MKSNEPVGDRETRIWRRLGLWLVALVLCFTNVHLAYGQTPSDVIGSESSSFSIPPAPKGYVRERVGRVTWAYHPSATSIAHELQPKLPDAWQRVTSELGATPSDELTIRIARGPADMSRLAPLGAPPPGYAVGVAYPSLGLVILSVVSPGTWLPPDLAQVLTHELSHIAVHRAVGGRPLPRWFAEGLAVHQAGEQNLARVQTLWEASVVGDVLPLSELSRGFPSRPMEVNRAYAQSADVVEHMLRDAPSRERLPRLLERVRDGMAFDQAVLAAYHVELPVLYEQWRQSLAERFRVLPLLLTGTALWGGIAVLAALAFVRRRKTHHEKLKRWEAEEAAYDRAIAALELQRQMALREDLAARQGSAPPPLPRDPGVPTVEHDGQRYTLH